MMEECNISCAPASDALTQAEIERKRCSDECIEIAFVGDSGAGKTTYVNRLIYGEGNGLLPFYVKEEESDEHCTLYVQKASYNPYVEMRITIVFVETHEYLQRVEDLAQAVAATHPDFDKRPYLAYSHGRPPKLPPAPAVADLFADDPIYASLPAMEQARHVSHHLPLHFSALRWHAPDVPSPQELAIDHVLFESRHFLVGSFILSDVRAYFSLCLSFFFANNLTPMHACM